MPLMTGSFVPLAIIARANIVLNIFVHPWPVEVAVHHLKGLIHADMTGNHGIMLILDDHLLQSLITWEPYFTFTIKHPSLKVVSTRTSLFTACDSRAFSYSYCQIRSSATFSTFSISRSLDNLTTGQIPWIITDDTITSVFSL